VTHRPARGRADGTCEVTPVRGTHQGVQPTGVTSRASGVSRASRTPASTRSSTFRRNSSGHAGTYAACPNDATCSRTSPRRASLAASCRDHLLRSPPLTARRWTSADETPTMYYKLGPLLLLPRRQHFLNRVSHLSHTRMAWLRTHGRYCATRPSVVGMPSVHEAGGACEGSRLMTVRPSAGWSGKRHERCRHGQDDEDNSAGNGPHCVPFLRGLLWCLDYALWWWKYI
jgi:hypothetical protein